jgi:hypothetical protein
MLDYHLWKEHVGHQLEVQDGERTLDLWEGSEMVEEMEATVLVHCLTCSKQVAEYAHAVAIRWNLEDVMTTARLSQGEAEVVLEELEHSHDASIGVNWEVMSACITDLFPEAEFLG